MRSVFAILFFALAAAGCTPQQQAEDHYINGLLLAQQDQEDAALAELAAAIKENPNLSVAHAAVGDIYRKRGDYTQARKSYEIACLGDPYAFRPHYNLGITYQSLAGAAKAVEQTEQWLRDAVKVYLRAAAIDPSDFDTNLNLSACYFQLGKYDLAEQYCQDAIKINPQSPQAHGNLGTIYDGQNKYHDAVREYKASLELDSSQPILLLNLGTTYMRQGHYRSAIGALEAAAREDANCANAYEQLGACHFHLREYDKALTAYNRSIELDDQSSSAHRGMGVVRMAQFILEPAHTDYRDEALASWRRSLELQPNQEDLLHLVQKYEPKGKPTQL